MKKALRLLGVLTAMLCIMATFVFASSSEGVVFCNADSDKVIETLNGAENIYARLSFDAGETSEVSVIVARYSASGALIKIESIDTVTPNADGFTTYTTPEFSVSGTHSVKIFVWDSGVSALPILMAPGNIDSKGNILSAEITLSSGEIIAKVPSGVSLMGSVDDLKLTTTPLSESESDISAGENEEISAFDVHVEGIANDNTVPIIITIPEAADKGLNKGNLSLYHVENGKTVEMEEVESEDELTAHNQFTYDPIDGTVSLAMATFSEVVLLSDTENAWNGEVDYSWYTENPDATEFYIANADQLAGFAKLVGGMAEGFEDPITFADKTVTLTADINLGDGENERGNHIFYPIGYYYKDGKSTVQSFEGTFDGAGHTISNFYHNTWEMKGDYTGSGYYNDAMGLFGYVYNGTVKNLTVANFSSDGEYAPTGCITAYAAGTSTFANISLENCNPRTYNTGVAGIVGWDNGGDSEEDASSFTFENITIDNTNKISALWGSWDVAAGGLMGYLGAHSTVSMTNCHVAAQIDVNNDVCGNYQYYWYRYSGMMIGTIDRHTTDANGYTVPDTNGITAEDCTVHFGDWNDYYYCELVANSLASYTHDHQFSRLTQVDSVDVDTMTVTVGGDTIAIPATGRCNYVVVNGEASTENATCYHFVDGAVWEHEDAGTEVVDGNTVLKENNAHIYLPFNQLFTGYGWGVKNIPIYNGEDYAFAGITILDREVADSVVKFESVANTEYTTGTTVTIGELFNAIENAGVEIDTDNVQVFVSPVGETSTASGVYTANAPDWTQGTLTFSGLGAATVTITDYYYCTPTVIAITVVEPAAVDKFTAKSELSFIHTVEGGSIEKTLGDVFEATNSASINSANIEVTVDNGICAYAKNENDWAASTLTFTGTGKVTITITDNDRCNIASATVTIVEPEETEKFALVFPNTDSYLYRIGNQNTVALSSLFKKIDGASEIGTVSIKVETIGGNVAHTYSKNDTDWTKGTLKFSGTGVVRVTVDDNTYTTPLSLNLEVVDAKNTTTASFSGNSVLLNNVTTSSTLSTSGIVYGNGFTVNMENAPISEKNGAIFHLYDGGVLKNLSIVGKEFTSVALNVNDTNYGVSVVRAWGTASIENCYISGCRSAVSVTGTELTIKDSVIANGIYANIDFRSGVLNLHNVTTVNEPHSVNGSTIVGLGIVGNMTASAGRQLNITGTLTQHNWVSQADCANIKAAGVDNIFNSVFTDSKYENLRYTYNGTTYVNTGILSLCSDFLANAVTGLPTDYSGMDVTATISGVSVNGYVWAPAQAGTLTDAEMAYHDATYVWTPDNSGTSFTPVLTLSNSGLTVESGVVQIEYESGDSYTLSNDILKSIITAQKYGENLPYTIRFEGNTVTEIVFDAAETKTYTIEYVITDDLVYDKDGNLTDTTYEVIAKFNVFATVVDKGADAPTFTFYYGTNGSASAGTPHTTQPTDTYTSKIIEAGGAYYIMPNVSATTANAIGSETVGGTTVYYPIVDGINVRSGNSTDYDFTRYYPIFKAVKISDNGTEYSYSATKETPATVSWVSATIDSGNGASALNDGFGLYNNLYLCKIQKKAGNTESGGTSVVKFSYTALDGNTYYYYVGYRFYDESESSGCFTADTLITMADGTTKQIQGITFGEKILAWDFFTGEYTERDIALLVNHGEELYTVANAEFSDGTLLKIIGDHGVFDYDLNKFVYITAENVTDYICHRFVKHSADGEYELVTMTNGYVTEEYTSAYSITSAGTSNAFASGVLTVAPPEDFYNWIEMGDKLRYDVEKFNADVEKYGLYTYDVFADYVTYDQFVQWNGAYLRIPVEKGIFTFEYILELIELYSTYMPH